MTDQQAEGAFLSTTAAGVGQQRLAAAVVVVSLVGFAATVPFARLPLAPVQAFIPSYEAALVLNDLITATLLFGQVARMRSTALLVLASGYLFTALMAVPHALTFPGVFSPDGLLGAGPQSTSWLFMFWHGGFPLFVIAYAVTANRDPRRATSGSSGRILAAIAGVLAVVGALTLLATAGSTYLPDMLAGGHYAAAGPPVVWSVWLASLAALVVLWRRRRRSVLDLWLMVVMCAWIFDIALSAIFNAVRFDLGFYAGRVYGLFAASFVLVVLLHETASLYARLERSQAQLHEARKMEAIGRLTGGIAHDFNNLLTTIIGNIELVIEEADRSQIVVLLHSAKRSAERGARLVSQLLAFGRRQILQPHTVDINLMLQEVETLLRRALGETIELTIKPDPYLWPCSVDPAQLETALINLALNARDAMPGGGTLTIATGRHEHGGDDDNEWRPGSYGAITVTDTGIGMSETVRGHAVEPFFTTKEVGKGSGLGLSQVYGFANQLGGNAVIASEPGRGTTVTIYLPRAAASASPGPAPPVADVRRSDDGETILVVEDDDDVRATVIRAVAALGYRVLTASNGNEAIAILGSDERIDLLFSDVVMPHGVSGVEVAKEARRLRRDIKVLLTSGYTADVLRTHGANGNFPIFAKPYRQQELADELRNVLRRTG